MSKAPMHSVYCINCDWELNNTHKCNGPVIQKKGSVKNDRSKRL